MTDSEIRARYKAAFDKYWQAELAAGRAPNNDVAFIHGVRAVLPEEKTIEYKLPGELWLAKWFHDTYEGLAPLYGYQTKEDTRRFDAAKPNGKLMIEVCRLLREQLLSDQRAVLSPPAPIVATTAEWPFRREPMP